MNLFFSIVFGLIICLTIGAMAWLVFLPVIYCATPDHAAINALKIAACPALLFGIKATIDRYRDP